MKGIMGVGMIMLATAAVKQVDAMRSGRNHQSTWKRTRRAEGIMMRLAGTGYIVSPGNAEVMKKRAILEAKRAGYKNINDMWRNRRQWGDTEITGEAIAQVKNAYIIAKGGGPRDIVWMVAQGTVEWYSRVKGAIELCDLGGPPRPVMAEATESAGQPLFFLEEDADMTQGPDWMYWWPD
ncbi:MAG: hypothetical protein LBR78_02060 [Holosporales bacterium]|jgi:hypothetical protein|nr:hypothetical protein [Holosporales bacterium]